MSAAAAGAGNLHVGGKTFGYKLSAAAAGAGNLHVGGKTSGYKLSAGAGNLLVFEFVRAHLRGEDTTFWEGSIEDIHRT